MRTKRLCKRVDTRRGWKWSAGTVCSSVCFVTRNVLFQLSTISFHNGGPNDFFAYETLDCVVSVDMECLNPEFVAE